MNFSLAGDWKIESVGLAKSDISTNGIVNNPVKILGYSDFIFWWQEMNGENGEKKGKKGRKRRRERKKNRKQFLIEKKIYFDPKRLRFMQIKRANLFVCCKTFFFFFLQIIYFFVFQSPINLKELIITMMKWNFFFFFSKFKKSFSQVTQRRIENKTLS